MTRNRNALTRNVRSLVDQLGDSLILMRKGEDNYNVNTGVATSTYIEIPVTVVVVQYNTQEIANDPSFLRDDRKAYVIYKGDDPFTVEIGDRIKGVGEDALVVSVREVLKNADSAMIYVCQVRG